MPNYLSLAKFAPARTWIGVNESVLAVLMRDLLGGFDDQEGLR